MLVMNSIHNFVVYFCEPLHYAYTLLHTYARLVLVSFSPIDVATNFLLPSNFPLDVNLVTRASRFVLECALVLATRNGSGSNWEGGVEAGYEHTRAL